MGNSVTTTAVESVKINSQDDADDDDTTTWMRNNSINGNTNNDYDNTLHNQTYDLEAHHPDYNYYSNYYTGAEEVNSDQKSIRSQKSSHSVKSPLIPPNPESKDTADSVSDIKDNKILNEVNGRKSYLVRSQTVTKESNSLPVLVRSAEEDYDVRQIDDLESIDSGSKLTLNDGKSDTDEMIQELNKMISETHDKELIESNHFRKRGQSWSTWDNNINVDLKTESSLSSFSRPASELDKDIIKPKSFTAPETRGQIDSAIEWLAKQHGIDIGSSLDVHSYDRHKTIDTSHSKQSLRISSMEIPGIVSTASTPVFDENEMEIKYDDYDEQLINKIETDFNR